MPSGHSPVGTDPISELMNRLRGEYLAEVPDRLAALRAATEAWSRGEPADPPLGTQYHRLSGSAGAYGFDRVSDVCRRTERWLATEPSRTPEAIARLEGALAEVAAAFAAGPTGPDIAG